MSGELTDEEAEKFIKYIIKQGGKLVFEYKEEVEE